ncbi:MAG: type VI secretion system tip protein VgrG, partial [Azonexaceae bacterium]|nr:type VI secretion system tip protein VgrG [Azonexaceae bacterium]
MEAIFTSETRLYELSWRDGEGPGLQVESWWGREALSGGFEYGIDLLSTDIHLELKRSLGRAATLSTRLADGSRAERTGLVRVMQKLGSDGGFARYRLTLVPWTWLLGRGRHNRVFQERTVIDIVETVFADYADVAAWQWSDETAGFLGEVRGRSYCVQYDESDYAFVSRLLAEEGIGWCIEEDAEAPAGHRLKLFADSQLLAEDVTSASGAGLRYHRADSQEAQDSLLAFGEWHRLTNRLVSGLAYDYKAKRIVTQSVPGMATGGSQVPILESYDAVGLYAWANAAEAERYGRLRIETQEARQCTWLCRSSVRSLRTGTQFTVTGLPTAPRIGQRHRYLAGEITHAGINNLTSDRMQAVAERLGGLLRVDAEACDPEPVEPVSAPTRLPAELIKLAVERGYGNVFEAYHVARPWRVILADGSGERLNPRETAPGPMSAIVVGPNGETVANGPDELWCDKLGRIKIRFHWQQGERADDRDSCWVRVISRQAGAGMGWQWLPRIGQEVLVDFLAGDIDRPYVLGALYNGRGEGGVPATPGGRDGTSDTAVFDAATDRRPGGQGNLAGGHSPAWHGGAAQSHRHAAALSGFKSKEFGGRGYNQLVFDDSDGQQRVQLKSTQHASELNLGHLIHQSDNYRGSFRGAGAEVRTDAWGALRAGQGMVMSTWPIRASEPAGDMAPAMALLGQAVTLARTLDGAAGTHRTVRLSGIQGSVGAKRSRIDEAAAPLEALHKLVSGMADGKDEQQAIGDAQSKLTQAGSGKVPQLTDAAIVMAGRGGIAQVAGQNLQIGSGETVALLSGEDSNLAVGGQARLHTGQAIGLVAGAVEAGEGNSGIKLIAGQGDVDLQAQRDEMKFQAKDDLEMISVTDRIDFAAGKRIVLAVEGGASIIIDGGITVQCPGIITIHASKKSFDGPARENYALP